MIKQQLLSYKGYHNREFQFIDENGQKYNFNKSRKDLIEDFDLTNETNVNLWFEVNYFIDKTPYTGYLAKKKGLYYYKNNRPGSKENRSAKRMHEMFLLLIAQYQLTDRKLKPLIKDVMLNTFKKQQKDTLQEIEVNKKAINDIERKLARLEERFVFEEINTAQYEKFKSMLTQEKNEKLMFSEKVGFNLSNLEKALEIALKKAPELSSMWAKGNLAEKRKIQKMVFPNGIEYDHKNDEYRTFRVNSFFSYIPALSKELGHKKTGKFRVKTKNSGSVPGAGVTFALTSFGSVNPGRWAYSTNTKGLRFGIGFYSLKKQNPEGFAFILRQYCDQSPQASLGGWSFTFSDALLCALFFGK